MNNLKILLILILFVFLPTSGFAQEEEQGQEESSSSTSKDWSAEVYLYGFLASIDSDTKLGGRESQGSVAFKDILESLDFTIMGHAEAKYKRVGILVDGVYLITTTHKSGVLGFTKNVTRVGIVDTGLTFLAFGTPPLESKDWSMALSGFLGARIWDLQMDLDTSNGLLNTNASIGETWADPLLGLRLQSGIYKNLFLVATGEIGGFGANSDLTWSAYGGLGYGLGRFVVFHLGYKALGVDFQNDKGGAEHLDVNLLLHGPLLGFGVHF